ncbi:hypothetical protein DPMN_142180 [Dreissena polymorpha]|uniref:Uncharacterized protein n=1 Tax=Dreissena polymorpha TaxID=45954 RepID=A0A9D4GAT2_DREPO|nr:hypothetical protein DPMN_142180 [Dreissena polymorpha]
MHRINLMKNTSAKNHAYGKRFKKTFDEIMSKTSIKQQFADIDVSLIYYDDRPFYEIWTDDTYDLVP